MKKNLLIILSTVFLISILSVSSYAATGIHPAYTPNSGVGASVDGTGTNFDKTAEPDAQIGTDFYISDYQDTVLTYQLTVEVPMYVALGVVGDGQVAVPSDNVYYLKNYSAYPVNVTSVLVNDPLGGWTLVTGTPINAKEISVALEGKNLMDLNAGTEHLSQLPAATDLNGVQHPYKITASATANQGPAQSGFQFSVSYTLELVK